MKFQIADTLVGSTTNSQSLTRVYAPGLALNLSFDQKTDFLGKGTVGEVFRASVEYDKKRNHNTPHDKSKCFALKRFLDCGERPHFARECKVLEALAVFPHPHIVPCLGSWTVNSKPYMLFPLGIGDLYHFFRQTPRPQPTAQFTHWFTNQLKGLCDALKYLHNYTLPILSADSGTPISRIGFHHDLKPVNILLFPSDDINEPIWKISDFGSGIVTDFVTGDQESIYNSKPSTGDPIYTAPEFALEGRVSRPKDIWSLGCIYLEALLWALDPSKTAIDDFQRERLVIPGNHPARKPMFWYQDHNGEVHMHPAVSQRLKALQGLCEHMDVFEKLRRLISWMLTVSRYERPTASQLCDEFDTSMSQNL